MTSSSQQQEGKCNWKLTQKIRVKARNIENSHQEEQVASFLRSCFGPIFKLENSPRLWSLVVKSQSLFMVVGLELENSPCQEMK